MARKYNSESSDDDMSDQQGKRRHTQARNGSRSDTHRDHADEVDSSGSDIGNRTKGYGRYNDHRGVDKDNERASNRSDKDGERVSRRDTKNPDARRKTEN